MPKRESREHETRIRRMVASGRYDADFDKRIDEIYREWNLVQRENPLAPRYKTRQSKEDRL
jgi:hypothetical protein